MKKIVMFLAVAAFAVGLQAASVTWTVTNIFSPADATVKAAIGEVTCYLVDDSVVSQSAMSSYLGGSATDKSSYIAGKSVTSSANNLAGKLSVTADLGALADGTYTYYTVIVAGDKAVVGSTVSATITSVGDPMMGSFNAKTLTTGTWTSIAGSTPVDPPSGTPEPTSGLLLLVGGALLALRRKQK